jgi:eukaryotic-like serine/threonine-protein kinase
MIERPPAIRELRPDVPPAVDELVQRMMAKNPHYRPQKAGEVVFLFERALALVAEAEPAPLLEPASAPVALPHNPTHYPNGHQPVHTALTGNGTGVVFAQPSVNPFQARSQRASNGKGNGNQFQVRTLREELNARTPLLEEEPKYPSLSDLTTNALKPPASPRLRWFKQHKIVGALALLAVFIGAAFGVFFAAKPYLTERDTVLVADFINNTGDEVFDVALKHALSVQLAQSPFPNLFTDDKVKETLRFMNRKPDERLTPAVAREIGQRQGLKAIIVGRIDRIGNNYSLSLQAHNSVTGETFGDTIAEARGKEQVLQALGKAATEFRKKLGESLNSIERFNKPIQDATTSSLDALKAYSLGREQSMRRGNPNEALTLYKHAVELDPTFALAYVGLATLYANRGESELAAENAEKAFGQIDRISEPERFSAWFTYHFLVKVDVGKAIEMLKLARQTYPNNPNTINNLAVCYGSIGQFEDALSSTQEVLARDPRNISGQINHAELQLRFSRFDAAKNAINELLAQKIERPYMHTWLYQIGMIQNDPALMQQQLDWALGRQDEVRALDWQAQAAAFKGKLREATQFYQRAIELNKQRQLPDQAASLSIALATRQAALGVENEAQQLLSEALVLAPNTFTKYPPGKAVPFGTFAFALAGAVQQAQLLCEETLQKYPRNTLANNLWVPATNATIQLQQAQPAKAMEWLRATAPYDPVASYVTLWLRGQAYLQLNKGREAAGEFQKILANQGWDPTGIFYPLAQLGLARAYALRGDIAESRKHYTEFFQRWKEADADLPILLAAKKELAALR